MYTSHSHDTGTPRSTFAKEGCEVRKDYKNFCQVIKMDKENDILIVDPFAINLKDFEKTGIKHVVRVRRPLWGQGIHLRIVKQTMLDRFISFLFNKCEEETNDLPNN